MKKIVSFVCLLCMLSPFCRLKAGGLYWFPEQDRRSMPVTLGISCNYAFSTKPLENSSPFMIGVDLAYQKLYFGWSSNLDHAKESRYGAGSGIDDHHLTNCFSAGYNFMIYEKRDFPNVVRFCVFPFASLLSVQDRTPDAYYGHDKVVGRELQWGAGAGFLLTNNFVSVMAKFATTGLSFGIAITFQ